MTAADRSDPANGPTDRAPGSHDAGISDEDHDDPTDDASEVPDLLAAAETLADASPSGRRGSSSTVRRRRGRIRGRGANLTGDDVSQPERVRVRTTTQEGISQAPSSRISAEQLPASDAERGLLDGSGRPIDDLDAGPRQPSPDGGGRVSAAPAITEVVAGGRVLDASVFLVDAVRSYLDAVEQQGPDDPIAADRRERLRRTLQLWDEQAG